ncbi:uncharacterized protein NEMAJ01_2045, partial [Nematocida major]|uniref:uncharacterized protein n=1 Tax=Nematocida major TaxID=1912982 RepID=UPI0020080EF1
MTAELGEMEGKNKFVEGVECKTEAEPGTMVRAQAREGPEAMRKPVLEYLDRLERAGVVRGGESRWRSPTKFVPKPDGRMGPASQMMALNGLMEKGHVHTAENEEDTAESGRVGVVYVDRLGRRILANTGTGRRQAQDGV